MDYKEKLKAIINSNKTPFVDIDTFLKYFPELKESEDERIRKFLIEDIKDTLSSEDFRNYNSEYPENLKEALTWLEKQGEQKYIPKYKIGDYVKNTNYKGEPIYEIVYMDKECYICEYRGKERMGDKAVMHFSFDNPYLRLVQKPIDKVEPKFKVGDWVFIEEIEGYKQGPFQIKYLSKQGYCFDKDRVIPFCTEDLMSFWTIKDAKDGDVLATDDGNIFVFDGTVEDDKYPFAYYGLTRRRFESYDRRLPFTHNNIHPATKEQRDQLEKAMADAGYTFDFEKKELRKIEQKFAEWSEEDENRFNNLIFLVECSDENEPTKKGFIDFINRLKFTSHQKYGSRVMSREDLLNKLEEIQTEYKRRMHDAQAKEDYIYASGLCDSISRVIKIVKED